MQETDRSFLEESSSQSPADIRERDKLEQVKPVEPASSQQDIVQLIGTVTAVHLPNRSEGSNAIYTNTLFMDKIKDFQASLLLKPNPTMDGPIHSSGGR